MSRLIQPLLFLFARCTKNELIRQVEFLKAENEILRSRVPQKRIILKPAERERLIELGKELGTILKDLITVVAYGTFRKWLRDGQQVVSKKTPQGRPKTPDELRQLIVLIRQQTGWGYTRIMGELKKLGIKPPSRSTVKNILREHGFDPRPERNKETWKSFIERHGETLWQCDFFSKRIWTWKGPRQFFALAFLHVTSRRVFVTPCTTKPNNNWMKEQTAAFVEYAKAIGVKPGLVMRDGDVIYRSGFENTLTEAGFKTKRLSYKSPNLNAFVERWVQSIQQECLDHFVVCGEKHFNHLISEYVEYYHAERPHQAGAVGGDYYDFFPMNDGSLGIIVADVAGHGLGPSIIMVSFRAFFRAFSATNNDLEVLTKLVNDFLQSDIGNERFVTFFLTKLNAQTRTFDYCGAGHESHLIRASGETVHCESTGLPIGVMDDPMLSIVKDVKLNAGDVLLLYTDGIPESRSPDDQFYGVPRMLESATTGRAGSMRKAPKRGRG